MKGVESVIKGLNMKGSCLCGGIEFEVTGLSGNIYQCHCTLCRKQGGSSSNTETVVPLWLIGAEPIKET